jgi:hypothetical protein
VSRRHSPCTESKCLVANESHVYHAWYNNRQAVAAAAATSGRRQVASGQIGMDRTRNDIPHQKGSKGSRRCAASTRPCCYLGRLAASLRR